MTTETQPLRGPLRKRDSHLWARDENDWYVEPEWCSERLFELERFNGLIYDPAAGMARIPLAAMAAGYEVRASDLRPRHEMVVAFNFWDAPVRSYTMINIVSNPPFKHAEYFAHVALAISHAKVALLLPANWVQGDKRSRWLETTPLRRVLFITPRPSMPPGAVVLSGGKPGNGTTDYAWFIWEHGYKGAPEIGWCRR